MTVRPNDTRRPAGEANFRKDELFFSRTDKRGVIEAGNLVFQRIAEHPWDKLLKAPHKIIRHEDMPKGLFWFVWDQLGKDQPVGAFIKNKSAEGRYYWVYAVMVPLADGYLSVRMKPGTAHLEQVSEIYDGLMAEEAEGTLEPEESAQKLLAQIEGLGWPNYQSFMSIALAEEMTHRGLAIGKGSGQSLQGFTNISTAVQQVVTETKELSTVFETIRGIPYNMRILASRMESAGGPISVISANYGVLSDEIGSWMKNFVEDSSGAFGEVRASVEEGLFLQCAALLQKEMYNQFRLESDLPDSIDQAGEASILQDQSRHYESKAQMRLREVVLQAERFSQSVRDMKRLITGLGATRMMCKIEGARLRAGGDSLSGVISQLDQFQDRIEERLSRIDDLNQSIQRNARDIVGDDSPAAKHAAQSAPEPVAAAE